MKSLSRLSGLARRFLFTALLLGSAASLLSAQPDGGFGPPPDGGPGGPDGMDASSQRGSNVDKELKKLTKQLSLSADQQSQIKIILTDRNKQIGEFMRANGPKRDKDAAQSSDSSAQTAQASPDEMFEKMHTAVKSIRGEANTKIAAQLTPDQATKFDTLVKQQEKAEEQAGPMGPPPDGGGPGGPPPGGGF